MKLKKLLGLALSGVLTISAIGCSKTQPENIDEKGNNKIVIGASAVPHAEILEEVKPILQEKGYELDIKVFDDYTLLNTALDEGSIDANFFQHVPYLEDTIDGQGYDLTYTAKVHIEPMGLYSKSIKSLDELKENLQFYFKYVDIRLMILLCKIGIYENSKAYTNLLGLIDIDDKPVFSESIGDIFNYRFNDKKVQIVLDIFNKELNKIAPSRALTKLRSMSASAEYENYNNKRWGNQLYLIIENLIEKLKATEYEEIDIDKVSYDFGEELIKWDETFEFKKVKIN